MRVAEVYYVGTDNAIDIILTDCQDKILEDHIMHIYLNGREVTGNQAEVHFVSWCLSLENENEPVAHCSLDASRDFQDGVYRHNLEKRQILKRSGIEVDHPLDRKV